MANKNSKNGKTVNIEKASESDAGIIYVILNEYYSHLIKDDDFCNNFYSPDKITEMIEKGYFWLAYRHGKPIATFALSNSPITGEEQWSEEEKTLYLECLAVRPESTGKGIEGSVCSRMAEKVSKTCDLMRVVTVDKLAGIYRKEGFEIVNADIWENYTFVFLEKKLGEQK